jgi:hypothetical protein
VFCWRYEKNIKNRFIKLQYFFVSISLHPALQITIEIACQEFCTTFFSSTSSTTRRALTAQSHERNPTRDSTLARSCVIDVSPFVCVSRGSSATVLFFALVSEAYVFVYLSRSSRCLLCLFDGARANPLPRLGRVCCCS